MNATKIRGIALIVLLAVSYGSSRSLGQTKAERGSGDQEQKQPKVTRTKGKPPAKAKIHPDVYRRLEHSRDGRAYVMVTLKPLPNEAVSDQQRKAAAKKSQDEFVAKMGADEFEVGYRHARDPILFGHVNATGLEKLAREDRIATVQYKIEANVHAKIRENPEEPVYVIVVLRAVDRKGKSHGERTALVNASQERVLRRLGPEDFKLEWQFRLYADFSGWASVQGLEKLAKDRDVVEIGVIPQTGEQW